MRSMRMMTGCAAVLVALPLLGCGGAPSAQTMAPEGGDWPMYRGDLAGTGHSPLAQITPANASDLAQAWSYSLHPAEPRADGRGPNSQATPIVVDGVMYLPAADRVVALDPVTGRELWRHPVEGGRAVAARRRLLGGRRRAAAAHPVHGGAAPDGARGGHRLSRCELR